MLNNAMHCFFFANYFTGMGTCKISKNSGEEGKINPSTSFFKIISAIIIAQMSHLLTFL